MCQKSAKSDALEKVLRKIGLATSSAKVCPKLNILAKTDPTIQDLIRFQLFGCGRPHPDQHVPSATRIRETHCQQGVNSHSVFIDVAWC